MAEADVEVLVRAREWLRLQTEERPHCAGCDGHGRRDCERCGAVVDSDGPRIVESLLDFIRAIMMPQPATPGIWLGPTPTAAEEIVLRIMRNTAFCTNPERLLHYIEQTGGRGWDVPKIKDCLAGIKLKGLVPACVFETDP